MTVYSYTSPSAAGAAFEVNGTECSTTSGATAVLVSLNSPSGESIAGTVATPYSGNGASGDWYVYLNAPITAVPSPDYTITVSCRAQGQLFAYAPVTVGVAAVHIRRLHRQSGGAQPG